MPSKKTAELRGEYRARKREIRQRLLEFEQNWQQGDKAIFSELAFCLCTPQSSALQCDVAVRELLRKKALLSGPKSAVSKAIARNVRFHKNKADYIIRARELLMPGIKVKLESLDIGKNPAAVRRWLVDNVKGLGMKEASHFLRNIGFGQNIAILDRHILRNLVEYRAIRKVPKNLNGKNYLEVEGKMKGFSKRLSIPFAELDLLFWSMETGKVFK